MSNDTTPQLREFARRLLDYHAAADKQPAAGGSAAYRICEQMRLPLGRLMGAGGFRSLLLRALVLAAAENSSLRELHVDPDGSLAGIAELEAKLGPREIALGEIELLSQLFGLLVTFIGVRLTLQLLREVWPQMDDATF
jgi:hypothetical protein